MYNPSKYSGVIPRKLPWKDPRRFKHAQFFGSSTSILDQLPRGGLGRKPISIEDQLMTNFCTAYATSGASEYIEGIDMSPEYQVAIISDFLGAPIVNGAQGTDALKALCWYGSLPKNKSPFSLEEDGWQKIADLKNWPPELREIARRYQKASYFDVTTGPFDLFDNMRIALFQAKQSGEERVIVAFTQWFSSWGFASGLKKPFKRGEGNFSWHAHLFIDWKEIDGELVMIEQNSYGEQWGDNGLSYWTREAINQFAENSSNDMYMLRDVSPDTVKAQQWTLAIICYNLLAKLNPLKAAQWLSDFIKTMTTQNNTPVPTPAPEPQPVPTTKKMLYDFCKAIETYEDYVPPGGRYRDGTLTSSGSLSWRNKNPGNCKYSSVGYDPKYGIVRKDDRGFAIFGTYELGFLYLQNLVKSKIVKNPSWDIYQYIALSHAPIGDSNDPGKYATYIATRLGVDIHYPMIKIISS